MDETFKVFDFHRILFGDAPPLFLLEIILRTFIMYCYAVFLLRLLGKRGMGQFSILELAIIISFGSSVGDPMIMGDMPILHGMTAITAVTFFQISLEKLINRSKKVEVLIEGVPVLIVDDGVIQVECMGTDNLSKEDLFRSLRGKDVEHLGEVQKAFLETSGQVSVIFHAPKNVKTGLSVIPEHELPAEDIFEKDTSIESGGTYCCMACGNPKRFRAKQRVPVCERCKGEKWLMVKK